VRHVCADGWGADWTEEALCGQNLLFILVVVFNCTVWDGDKFGFDFDVV
jgi:hypothetical protein